jgi:hypothetical protein
MISVMSDYECGLFHGIQYHLRLTVVNAVPGIGLMKQRKGTRAVAVDLKLPGSLFMPLKIVFALMVLAFSTHLTGCSTIDKGSAFVRSLYSPTGTSRVPVGEVGVTASAAYAGAPSDDALVVSADELGNAILSGGKGTLVMTPLALNDTDRNEAIELLKALAQCGDAAKREKVETSKYVGALSSDMGLMNGSAVIGIDCISPAGGKAWMGKMNICYIDLRYFSAKKPDGSGRCDKEIDMFISPDSTSTLIALLEKVPRSFSKDKNSKSKDALSK